MQPSDFSEPLRAQVVRTATGYWAFVPPPLPPDLAADWALVTRLSLADRSLAQLAGLARNLPNPHLLIRPFVRREAVSSSRIEGTQASLSDLLFFEAAEAAGTVAKTDHTSDVRDIADYVRAMDHGLERLAALPLSLRLIRELHRTLMQSARGESSTPGEFRRSQNWIGPPGCLLAEATFVPPPIAEMMQALDALEKFLHAPSELPPLIRLALIHYQFEAIHPFLDGNGRVGRLLITMQLCADGLLAQPVLYLSAFFERHRDDYYRRLLAVSQAGQWHEWIDYFLAGLAEQSRDAVRRSARLLDLREAYRHRIAARRSSALLLRFVDSLFERPVFSVTGTARHLDVTYRSASQNIGKLIAAGLVAPAVDRRRDRLFIARGVIDAIESPLAAE